MKMRRMKPWGWWALVALAAGLAAPGGPSLAVSNRGEPGFNLYLPALLQVQYVYLPAVVKVVSLPVALNNPSFENEKWFTDPQGNQRPVGWTFFSPAAGQTMPFPTKMQQGNVVPAVSNGPGEYVHKYWWQLPKNEWLGGPRGLILDGDLVYKAFGGGGPHALRLSQTVTSTAGATVRVAGYILGETHDGLPLEADHFVAALRVNGVEDKRTYASMIQNHDVPDNERPWNRFVVTITAPANGLITIELIVQQNWAGRTDFFLDNFSAERIFEAP
jgi:hypothetical protein